MSDSSVQVHADHGTCVGSGLCQAFAPRYFDASTGSVVIREQPAGREPEVAAAVDNCPVQALRFTA